MPGELQVRTRTFAVDVLRFVGALPPTPVCRIVQWQLGRAGSSVGSNYRRACIAQSRRDFVAKLKVVEEEADESGFWLDVCSELRLGNLQEAKRLNRESEELKAMVVASVKTTRMSLHGR